MLAPLVLKSITLPMTDLIETWTDIASRWHDWGPPLRPCSQDVQAAVNCANRSLAKKKQPDASLYLCGVTPELADANWSERVSITAVDRSESMVRKVWPGDIPGRRTASVGDWLSRKESQRYELVVNDGGFVFFGYKKGQHELLQSLADKLKPGGMVIARLFLRPERVSLPEQIIERAVEKEFDTFHEFKWRLAMAIQGDDASKGASIGEVWSQWSGAAERFAHLEGTFWPTPSIETINFYRGREATIHFPSLSEVIELFEDILEDVGVIEKNYTMGELCPTLYGTVT